MKQWLKKVIRTDDFIESQQKQTTSTSNKNRRIVVSFDKHIQNSIHKVPQKIINPKIEQFFHQYEQEYIPRSDSNLSKCVEIDQDQVNKVWDSKVKNLYKDNSKRKDKKQTTKNKKLQLQKNNTTNKKKNQLKDQLQIEKQRSSGSETSSLDDQAVEISQQIVNSLISMQNLINMIKSIPETNGQYITLKYINRILVSGQIINKVQLSNYLLNKSSQEISVYCNKNTDKGKIKTYNRFVKKLTKNKNQSDEEIKRSYYTLKFYYRTFSNGLTYQYYPVRALIWKIVSGYLPDSKQKWIWKMQVSLLKYRQLVKEHIIQTTLKTKKNTQRIASKKQKDYHDDDQKGHKLQLKQQNKQITEIRKKSQTFSDPLSRLNTLEKQEKDHPLNSKQNSRWKNYFEDYQIWSIIQKDTIRTRQSYSFFKQAKQFSLTNQDPIQGDIVKIQMQNNEKIEFRLNELHLSKYKKDCTTYIDALTRIIYIYLKVHPEQQYYQGMNDIVAVMYYSLTNKNNEYFRRVSQSDTYEIFTLLMNQLKFYPLHNIDTTKLSFNHFTSGQKYFDLLKSMIHKYDFRLHDFLSKNKGFDYLKAISIRWFLTIFLTQFSLDDALILWDAVMILIGIKNIGLDDKKQGLKNLKLTELILYMALGVIHLNRNEIFPEDTTQIKDCSNILIIFQKIKQKPQQIIEKTINLYKSFPNLFE